jgi:hypothetical protein
MRNSRLAAHCRRGTIGFLQSRNHWQIPESHQRYAHTSSRGDPVSRRNRRPASICRRFSCAASFGCTFLLAKSGLSPLNPRDRWAIAPESDRCHRGAHDGKGGRASLARQVLRRVVQLRTQCSKHLSTSAVDPLQRQREVRLSFEPGLISCRYRGFALDCLCHQSSESSFDLLYEVELQRVPDASKRFVIFAGEVKSENGAYRP